MKVPEKVGPIESAEPALEMPMTRTMWIAAGANACRCYHIVTLVRGKSGTTTLSCRRLHDLHLRNG